LFFFVFSFPTPRQGWGSFLYELPVGWGGGIWLGGGGGGGGGGCLALYNDDTISQKSVNMLSLGLKEALSIRIVAPSGKPGFLEWNACRTSFQDSS